MPHSFDASSMTTSAPDPPPAGVSGRIETPLRDAYDGVQDHAYDPWLLEDHPLRSYPTECCPGLFDFIRNRYCAARKNWDEQVFRLVCFLLMLLMILQLLMIIPYGISYLFPSENWQDDWDSFEEYSWISRWPGEFQNPDSSSRCLLYSSRAHSDVIQLSAASGCSGAKADVWLHNDQILVGSSVRHLDAQYTLREFYLDPLLRRFEGESERTSLPEGDPFVLVLDLRTSMRSLWPHLVAQLEPLREAGYLTQLNGSRVIPGRLTVVVMGQTPMEKFGMIDTSSNDIFFDASLDELVLEDYDSPSGFGNNGNGLDRTASPGRGDTRPQSPTLRSFYCATANFKESVGFPRRGRFSKQQIELIRAQVGAARQRGLLVRYEGIPRRNRRLQRLIWRVLVHEGADLVEMSVGGGVDFKLQVSGAVRG